MTGGTAGEPGQELWCIPVGSAHNIVIEGIEADGMGVWLFSDPECTVEGRVDYVETDGCHVIPSNVSLHCWACRVLVANVFV